MTSDMLTSVQVEKLYRDNRARFEDAIYRAMEISVGAAGLKSEHGRQFWSSVLFTKLLVTCITVKRLCPRRGPIPDRKPHWDFGSVASLVRNIAECHLAFFYLCVDEVKDEEEWQVRQHLLFVRDNRARHRMMTEFGADADDETYFKRQAELKVKLESYPSFMALPEKRRAELLKGDKTPYIQDEILEKMGLERNLFRGYYRYLSSHVHTGPISFFRMAEQGRGNGTENDYDKAGIAYAVEFAAGILETASEQMLVLHPSAALRGLSLLQDDGKRPRTKKRRGR